MDTSGLTLDVERRYRRGQTIEAAFDLDLAAAETLVLFGPSGSGKTTILRCLAGLERPDRGRIVVGGRPWVDVQAGVHVSPQRRRVGYLPQGFALFPHLTVRQNLAYGMDGPPAARAARLDELVTILGLTGLEERRPGAISGGQQQRVALGRAIARDPVLLLLDEPLAALDLPTREGLRLELRGLLRRLQTPAVVVTHDRTEALVLGDRIAVLIDGRIRQTGKPDDVFNRPADAEVAAATGVETIARGRVETVDDGLVTVRVGDARLAALADVAVGQEVVVSIRPEDVLIVPVEEDLSFVSARNHLVGTLLAVDPLGPLVRLQLDCGFPLVAYVTRQAREELGIEAGQRLAAMIKAPSVHVIPIGTPAGASCGPPPAAARTSSAC
ncbi:MAG: ABC transporter ATP-binding protein [Chloroflexota bacterium]